MKQERTIDLDGEQYQMLKLIIETHIPHKEVWAYGSRVKWKASVGADLDLAVFDCDFSTLAAFREALEESNLVISVDVMNWEKIPDDFKENIKKKYVVVQKMQSLITGWKKMKLGNLVYITSSKRIFYKEYMKTGVPFYRSKEIIEKHNKQDISTDLFISEARFDEIKQKHGAPEAEDLLLTAVGTLGVPYIVKQNERFYFKDGNLLWFRNFSKDLFNKFIYYWIISPIGIRTLQTTNIGSTQLALTIDNLNKLSINIPPLPEQKIIAEILSGLDDKIDLLRRQNKTLETIAQTFFRKQITNNSNRENWGNVKLSEIYDFLKGCEPGSKYYQDIKSDKNVRFIRVRDMLKNTGSVYIPKECANMTCEKTDLLMSFDGTIGKVSHGIKGAYSSGIRKIVSLSDVYNNLGLKYLLFTNKYVQNIIQQHAIGTVILHASGVIQYLKFRLPDEEKLTDFNQLITPIFDKIVHNQEQIHTLEKSRDRLLPKIMNGKARIKQQ